MGVGLMGTRIATIPAAVGARSLQSKEEATYREQKPGKIDDGRSVYKVPNDFRRLANKSIPFHSSGSEGSVLDQQTHNNGISDRIIAESVGQENKVLLAEIRHGVKLQSKGIDIIDSVTTNKALEVAGREIREARNQELLAKHVYCDPRYAKALGDFELAEDWRRTREQLNNEICHLINVISALKTCDDYEARKVSIEARMLDLCRKFEALDVEDKGIYDLEQYREMERDNNCYLQGTVLDILQDKLAEYGEMLKAQGTPVDRHDHKYFALLNLVGEVKKRYLNLARPYDANAVAEKRDSVNPKGTLDKELQVAIAKPNQTATTSKVDFGKLSDGEFTIDQIGALNSEIDTSEDDDDDDEFFLALEYLEDNNEFDEELDEEFFDALEYQPGDIRP